MPIDIEAVLRDEFAAGTEHAHYSSHVFDAAYQRYRSRRNVTRTLVGTAVGATAVAVCATAVTQSGSSAGRPDAATSGGVSSTVQAPAMKTVAYVRPKILQALSLAQPIIRTTFDNYNLQSGNRLPTTHGSKDQLDQVADNWFDTDTGYDTVQTTDSHGTLLYVDQYKPGGGGTDTAVDYTTRTFVVTHPRQRPAGPTPVTGKGGAPNLDTIAGIRAAVQRPDVEIVGQGQVDGQEATHLRFTMTVDGSTMTGDAWFDSSTYAPLKSTTRWDGSLFETTSFLPRTAGNIAQTVLTVPTGFQQVAPPVKPTR